MKEMKIGQYVKSVAGKKAVLKQEIVFSNVGLHEGKKIFPPGSVVVAVHEVYGTGLTTFEFVDKGRTYKHVVREGKFEYIS